MIIVPTSNGFALGSTASLLDDGGPLRAWVERHVRQDPDIRWIVGNYVEADNANSNGHIFPLDELLVAQTTVAGKPLNMLHREHYIVGCFAGSQLMDEGGVELDQAGVEARLAAAKKDEKAGFPYVEALAGLWHTRFPEEFFQIQAAHKEGSLFFSMEAIPEAVSCPTCEHEAVFAGLESDTYCEHMQGATGPKVLRRPVFSGGAIIIPPVRPGWDRADIKTISKMYEQDHIEKVRADVEAEFPHLGPGEWEWMMAQVMTLAADGEAIARKFTEKERKDAADKGQAKPDGSFPIKNAADLKNAIKAVGRAKNPKAAKAHIKSRAKALGLEHLLPDGW